MRKIIATVRLQAIKNNAKAFKRHTGVKLCAVVKANAYGHGAEEVANALSGIADCFAVALLDEALALRVATCGKDILILTPPISEEDILACAKNGFIVTLPDLKTARLAERVCERYGCMLRVHLKVNTGMNRYGMHLPALGKTCKYLRDSPYIRVEGVYSHIYDIGESEPVRERFLCALRVYRRYFAGGIAHLSATAGATLGRAFAFDMVRIGLGLYGYLPEGAHGLWLEKAMRVHTRVIADRKYVYGGAGYGIPKISLKGKHLCVCRYGYADGFLRNSDNGVDGAETQAGNLCMDACVRVGKRKRGDTVTLVSDADETAKATGTIAYEVLCASTRRAEIIYE